MEVAVHYEDGQVLVLEKPPGMPSQKDYSRALDVESWARNHTGGEMFLVHRLDRPVGGLMVLAKDKRSAALLSKEFAGHQAEKEYLAVACGAAASQGSCRDHLHKGRGNRSEVVEAGKPGAKEAVLHYRLLETREVDGEPLSLLEIRLESGRHHQIRVQLANARLPLWGDTKYNPRFQDWKGWVRIGLFSSRLRFIHPGTGRRMEFAVQPKGFPFDLFEIAAPDPL
ncbi:RNA pseudouridine synthase [Anaerotalea alkaliphila]|uniref:RluA family pseudouridine synthase n=1 Tax=Anaerotalea alkaliphila TaxID=2662126 RepID=UPI0031B586A2